MATRVIIDMGEGSFRDYFIRNRCPESAFERHLLLVVFNRNSDGIFSGSTRELGNAGTTVYAEQYGPVTW